MYEEFFQLSPLEKHEEFLRDWWSPRKLFRGPRGSGKTTMMLCEANRFIRNDVSLVYLTPTRKELDMQKEVYRGRFGERMLCDFATYENMERKLMGRDYNAIIADGLQETTFNKFLEAQMSVDPIYIRASADVTRMNQVHYLMDEDGSGFFDAVYGG